MQIPLLIHACNAIGNLTKTLKKNWLCSFFAFHTISCFQKKKAHIFRTINLSYLEQHIVIKLSFLFLGYYHKDIGLLQTGVPECRLFGYTRDLPSMPPRALQDLSWPKSDAFVPLERSDRGKYYGYYHEAIERERQQRKKELPESMRVEARDIPML